MSIKDMVNRINQNSKGIDTRSLIRKLLLLLRPLFQTQTGTMFPEWLLGLWFLQLFTFD